MTAPDRVHELVVYANNDGLLHVVCTCGAELLEDHDGDVTLTRLRRLEYLHAINPATITNQIGL